MGLPIHYIRGHSLDAQPAADAPTKSGELFQTLGEMAGLGGARLCCHKRSNPCGNPNTIREFTKL
jgi:hypothetical protein